MIEHKTSFDRLKEVIYLFVHGKWWQNATMIIKYFYLYIEEYRYLNISYEFVDDLTMCVCQMLHNLSGTKNLKHFLRIISIIYFHLIVHSINIFFDIFIILSVAYYLPTKLILDNWAEQIMHCEKFTLCGHKEVNNIYYHTSL